MCVFSTPPKGFLDDTLEPDEASLAIEAEYPCKVLPLSKLAVNETAIENGDTDHMFANFIVSAAELGEGGQGEARLRGWHVILERDIA